MKYCEEQKISMWLLMKYNMNVIPPLFKSNNALISSPRSTSLKISDDHDSPVKSQNSFLSSISAEGPSSPIVRV